MKNLYKRKFGNLVCVVFVANVSADPEETKRIIEPMITDEMTEEDVKHLYMEYRNLNKYGNEVETVSDEVGAQWQQKLDAMGKNKLLLETGEYADDYCGVEYWIKKSGKWVQKKVEEYGVGLPPGAVLQENLTNEQQQEISAQKEAERIAALTPEEKIKEKKNRLHAVAREAIMLEQEAELLDEVFDKRAWILPRKQEIEALYA